MSCKLIKLGDATAIICGGKEDHECDSSGSIMYILKSGEYVPRDQIEDEEDVCGGCVSCSICGKPFMPPMF